MKKAGITTITTIDGVTTVSEYSGNASNVSFSYGNLDFSKRNPKVPDGLFVDGGKQKEKTITREELRKRRLAEEQEKARIAQEEAAHPQPAIPESGPVRMTPLSLHVGNQRIETEFKQGEAFEINTSLGGGSNTTTINKNTVIDHGPMLYSAPALRGGVGAPRQGNETPSPKASPTSPRRTM